MYIQDDTSQQSYRTLVYDLCGFTGEQNFHPTGIGNCNHLERRDWLTPRTQLIHVSLFQHRSIDPPAPPPTEHHCPLTPATTAATAPTTTTLTDNNNQPDINNTTTIVRLSSQQQQRQEQPTSASQSSWVA